MEGANIIPVNIEDEMRGSYLDYAMSVIIGRALPDVRDGLKPVHRRILFAMLNEGLTSTKRFSKCAGVVGEVLKHLHPHGDSAVYSALVRMAQPWNLRYPLIEGQGNFGSIDGDSPAAYRYTECRMQPLADALLADLDKDTVDFVPNFDDSMEEPVVLPTRIPNLLINGAEGIAVGMASSIPPHNLRETIAGAIRVIEDPDVSIDELMELIPGPDFPTGGIIYGAAPLREIYRTGRGLLQIRAKIHTETIRGEGRKEAEAIIVDEIPYQVSKARLIEKIAELVNERKIEGIARLRDESDRQGMRVVLELKRDAVADVVINQLYKLTPMQRTFGVIMLSIVDGRPRVLSLKEMLEEFVNHRRTVITRRSRYELAKAKARLHILEGFRIALEDIDAVIAVIKASESTVSAREKLEQRFSLSEIQAQHILDMPLKRLTGLERQAIDEEYEEVSEIIEGLEKILSDAKEVDRVCIEELREIVEKYGDDRRTVIEEDGGEINLEDMIVEEDMVVTISHRGYAKRCSPSLYRAQRRGGKGVRGTKKLEDTAEVDFIEEMFIASTHAYLLTFTSAGRLYWLKVYELPEAARTARGRAIVNMIRLEPDEKVSAILPVREFEAGKFVMMATRRGYIKKVDLMEFSHVRQRGIRAISLDPGDDLMSVCLTDGSRDCLISTKGGVLIRFSEDEVRPMGRTARGVRSINLEEGDEVVNLVTAEGVGSADQIGESEAEDTSGVEFGNGEDGDRQSAEEKGEVHVSGGLTLLTVCQNGYGKRTLLNQYRCQGRGGKGIIDIKTTERNGPVVGATLVNDDEQAMLITTGGKVIRMRVSTIPVIGRNTQGVRLVHLDEGEQVAALARLAESEVDEGEREDSLESNGHDDGN